MNNLKNGLVVLFGVTMIFAITSCKKYDEGGRLGAADRKIVNSWKVDKATDLEDGSNITGDYKNEVWEFTKDNDYRENAIKKGTYTFSEDKKTLIILKSDGGSDTFKILKLKSDEMWLEELGEEEIHLVPAN